ncbi:MAG: amidohydrolase family protein [Thermoguttaceae bacterium]|nr:amidohydrolase family protein [Thermoguttaceae bacterium]
MRRDPPVTLKARYVFPVSGEPIAGGAVVVQGGRIVAVGQGLGCGEMRDLGPLALVPAPVNAHTHLELSDLDAPLGQPGTGFVAWIREVIRHRRTRAGSAEAAVARGLAECERFGTAAVGEIAQPDWSPGPVEKSPLDTTVFLELIAPTKQRAGAAIERAERHLEHRGTPWRAGLAPHAPYTVRRCVLQRAAALCRTRGAPIAFHLAESREEIELLRTGAGPLRAFLEEAGAYSGEFGRLRPLDFLQVLDDAPKVLVIHGNYLDDEEIAFLADRRQRMAVAYCPRTHARFGHDPFPLAKMLSAGVSLSLGTDSRASSPDLNLWAEVQCAAARHVAVPPRAVLEMATLGGARALGCEHELGSLAPGKRARLLAVELPDRVAADPHELLVEGTALPAGTGLDAKIGTLPANGYGNAFPETSNRSHRDAVP